MQDAAAKISRLAMPHGVERPKPRVMTAMGSLFTCRTESETTALVAGRSVRVTATAAVMDWNVSETNGMYAKKTKGSFARSTNMKPLTIRSFFRFATGMDNVFHRLILHR